MKVHTKVGSVVLGLAVAAGLAVVGTAPSAHAMRFNPQPDPPGVASVSADRSVTARQALLARGVQLDFNPQPDPPGRHAVAAAQGMQIDFNPQPDPPGRHAVAF